MSVLDSSRIRIENAAPLCPGRAFVLYWCTAARRTRANAALQRAAEAAAELRLPLVVFEPLRAGYPYASDRLHRFVIEGMIDNRAALAGAPVTYLPYVEPEPGAGKGLLEALARHAALVVGDDYPCFFLPHMTAAAARRLDVRLELVDGNGLYPMRATRRTFTVAHSFRRHLQHELPRHLRALPRADPLAGLELPRLASLPPDVTSRWPAADLDRLRAPGGLAGLPIDHGVAPAPFAGGPSAAAAVLDTFLDERLDGYGSDRNDPDAEVSSGLSPYLHFGHVGAQEVFARIVARAGWTVDQVEGRKPNGSRHGWWQLGDGPESFLDQLVTWRELGFNACCTMDDFDKLDALPHFAQRTLAEHAADPRPHLYTLEQLEQARTDDPVWNAAQRQLVVEGRVHNYLRMLWGKRVLEWTRTPREASEMLVTLNDRYAVDGRDPNSYTGIFWVFGRYDRAWGPERPIFGKVRYMSSTAARRKLAMENYLAIWSD